MFQILAQTFTLTVLMWVFSRWCPRHGLSIDALRDLFGFSASVFATQLIQYIASNLDKMFLGKFLGGAPLGIYDKAHSMMLFPLRNISHVIGNVMFPSLSLIQSDKDRVRNIYLRTTRAISLLTFPMMTGMFVVSESFVLGVLGESWRDMILVLRIFCVAGVMTSIVTVTGAIYKSQGKAALQLKVNLFTKPITITGLIIGLQWGLIGVAVAYTATTFINRMITLTVAGRLVGLKL